MSNSGYKSERLETQLIFKLDPRKWGKKTKREQQQAIKEARANFMQSGYSGVPGVKIEGRWRNPDNRNPVHANWKYTTDEGQSLHDFWKTLGKGRGALR